MGVGGGSETESEKFFKLKSFLHLQLQSQSQYPFINHARRISFATIIFRTSMEPPAISEVFTVR